MGRELLTSASYLPIRCLLLSFLFPRALAPTLAPPFTRFSLIFYVFSRYPSTRRLASLAMTRFSQRGCAVGFLTWKNVHDRTVWTRLRWNAWNAPSEKRKAEGKGNGRVETRNIPCSDFYAANKRVLVPAGNSSGSKVARRRVGGR